MTMNSIDYLSDYDAQQELLQNLSDMIDYIQAENWEEFSILLNKYRDFYSEGEATEEVLKEFGYTYLVNLLEASNGSSADFRAFIHLLHFLKGSRDGMEFGFRLLNIEVLISEWWEQTPEGTPDTYTLEMTGGQVTQEVVDQVKIFSRQYVYPILEEVVVNYIAQAPLYFIAGHIFEVIAECETSWNCGAIGYFKSGSVVEVSAFCSTDDQAPVGGLYWY